MTSCPRPEDLYLYLEGELGPYEARKLEEHVECCTACREALAERSLLHEAFTSLPPFEVPPDFAKSVMDRLPEPEAARPVWLRPLLAGSAALAIGLLGFYLLTGTSLVEILVAVNGFLGSAVARIAPLAVKTLKLGGVLLKVVGDLLAFGLEGLGTFTRLLGLQGILALLGLVVLLTVLAVLGARRFLRQGEQS